MFSDRPSSSTRSRSTESALFHRCPCLVWILRICHAPSWAFQLSTSISIQITEYGTIVDTANLTAQPAFASVSNQLRQLDMEKPIVVVAEQ